MDAPDLTTYHGVHTSLRKAAHRLSAVAGMLDTSDPRQMVEALRALPYRRRPSKVHIPGLLDGLSVINSLVDQYLGDKVPAGARSPRLSVVGAA